MPGARVPSLDPAAMSTPVTGGSGVLWTPPAETRPWRKG